jgi:hypothetical protein
MHCRAWTAERLAACPRPLAAAVAAAAIRWRRVAPPALQPAAASARGPAPARAGAEAAPPAAAAPPPLYEWEFNASTAPRPAATDLPVPAGLTTAAATAALQRAAAAGQAPPDEWLAAALPVLEAELPALAPALTALAAVGCAPPAGWAAAALAALQAGFGRMDSRQLAAAFWAVGELGVEPPPAWAAAAHGALLARLPDFFAPDFAAAVCAVGSWEAKPTAEWAAAVAGEAAFQLGAFAADFAPRDLARLISGAPPPPPLPRLMSLGAFTSPPHRSLPPFCSNDAIPATWPPIADRRHRAGLADVGAPVDEALRTPLMTAVHLRLRTIGDKAAIDFALAKLEAGARSMHFDPRWTHEELHWLPRRERDKRRILKDGWYRTKWGGWSG